MDSREDSPEFLDDEESCGGMLENQLQIGDLVEVFVRGKWIEGKIVHISNRALIVEYWIQGVSHRKLYRDFSTLALKGTHLKWNSDIMNSSFFVKDHSLSNFDEFKSPSNSPYSSMSQPSASSGEKRSEEICQEHNSIRQHAAIQRQRSQQLLQKNIQLRQDFDRLCEEFGHLQNQFKQSMELKDVSLSSSTDGLCPHFLKGKCRFKDHCRQSHDILYCVYCQAKLPSNRVASSAHLGKCYKARSAQTSAPLEK